MNRIRHSVSIWAQKCSGGIVKKLHSAQSSCAVNLSARQEILHLLYNLNLYLHLNIPSLMTAARQINTFRTLTAFSLRFIITRNFPFTPRSSQWPSLLLVCRLKYSVHIFYIPNVYYVLFLSYSFWFGHIKVIRE